ncbi:MAG: hypothetical protein IPP90_01165 [Gemmatimonadaceae bacterium]|nr:hypothetical protein [Gemmatimonadaceae bacterium]
MSPASSESAAATSATVSAAPLMSVVVTIVEGGAALPRLLRALVEQEDAPPMEILVPYDESVRELAALQSVFPTVQFLPLGTVSTEQPIASAGGEHELFDRRRAVGLRAARGELIAIVEDRGAPRSDWARTAAHLHARLPYAVIGGAIDPLASGIMGWAIHVCDFTRYSSPFQSGARDWVSDVNVIYKRRALEQTRDLWQERYQEPVVHWALQQQGETLFLSDELVVEHQRAPVLLARLLNERFHWGRLFGAIRGRHLGVAKRLMLAAAGPLIPFTVFARHARAHVSKGRGWRFASAAPAILLLLTVWTAGEVAGIVTRRT